MREGKDDPPVRPLAGIRVLGFTAAHAGPLTTAVLADLGADVVTVGPPDPGDGCRHEPSPGRQAASHDAPRIRHVALDLAAPAGADLAARLAAVAGVLVEDLPAGALESFGLGSARLHARNPQLVSCSVPGLGPPGPRGPAEGELAASLCAVGRILAALQERACSGRGRRIEIPVPAPLLAEPADAAARPGGGVPALVDALAEGEPPGAGASRAAREEPLPGLPLVPRVWQTRAGTPRLGVLSGPRRLHTHRRPLAAVPARGPRGGQWQVPRSQHTDEVVLDWLGCRAEDVEQLRCEGAFG